MGIFDIFSGSAGKQAAADQIAGINQGKDEATAAFGQGRDALTTDYAKGLSEWDPVTKTANQGQLDYGADTSIGKAQAGGDMADYNASGNLWGAGLALAGDAAQAFGGGGVGKVKNLFGSFGAGAPAPAGP
jgi:hypothetical protein